MEIRAQDDRLGHDNDDDDDGHPARVRKHMCKCEFDAYDDGSDEESWHFRRVCTCGAVLWSLHCPHDGVQSTCVSCGERFPCEPDDDSDDSDDDDL